MFAAKFHWDVDSEPISIKEGDDPKTIEITREGTVLEKTVGM